MAASLASNIRRSPEARSRSQMASWPAVLSSRARWSRKARRRSSSSRVMMPSVKGLLDVEVRGVTALGDGLAEGDLVEGVGRGGLGGELDHFLAAGGVEVMAWRVPVSG